MVENTSVTSVKGKQNVRISLRIVYNDFSNYLQIIDLMQHILLLNILTISWRRPISCRNQSIDLLRKSMDWILYDIGLRHERVNRITKSNDTKYFIFWNRLFEVLNILMTCIIIQLENMCHPIQQSNKANKKFLSSDIHNKFQHHCPGKKYSLK